MYRTVVTVCTAQWSLYVPHSGHYMYRTVVTICTAQWSLYVPHSGHYMDRTVVTVCTAQWSLYVPHSGHYMYRPVVTICTAQWSLYVPHSGHYMYRTMVTICTTSLTFNNSTFSPHTVFICFVWISEQTAIISLYNINWLLLITQALSCVLQRLKFCEQFRYARVIKSCTVAVATDISQQGPCWVSAQSMWDLWLTEWHWDRFVFDRVAMEEFFLVIRVSPVSIIPFPF